MEIARILDKPEYLFRPSQIFRRIFRTTPTRTGRARAQLPWGLPIMADNADAVGNAILSTGIFDLPVTEAIWRLIDPGELVVDVGANIGYFTGLMAGRVGARGTVVAVEAHPGVFSELSENVSEWSGKADLGKISLLSCALGMSTGIGRLVEPTEFERNRGIAHLAANAELLNGDLRSYSVDIKTLDSLFVEGEVSVLKVDVEGAEHDVLRGAIGLLERKAVRDIIFEDFGAIPSPAMALLEELGYSVFAVERSFFGPTLNPIQYASNRRGWDSPNFLATVQPDRAVSRTKPRGWRCFRSSGSRVT